LRHVADSVCLLLKKLSKPTSSASREAHAGDRPEIIPFQGHHLGWTFFWVQTQESKKTRDGLPGAFVRSKTRNVYDGFTLFLPFFYMFRDGFH
jgi:hypothetical protein